MNNEVVLIFTNNLLSNMLQTEEQSGHLITCEFALRAYQASLLGDKESSSPSSSSSCEFAWGRQLAMPILQYCFVR